MKESLKHIKPLLYFALVTLAVTLYTVFDKTLIGLFLDKSEAAFYEYADKIIAIPKMFLLTIGAVLFPKMCSLEASDESKKISQIHIISLFFAIGIGIGAVFGLFALGKPAITLYYGENFAKSGDYIVYMSPLILFVTLGDILRTQFIIPKKKDGFLLLSVSLNAILNLTLSLILIKPLGVYGVIIGTMVAELFGCVLQMVYCRKYTNFRKISEYFLIFIVFGIFMFGTIRLLDYLLTIPSLWKTIIMFIVGVFVYSVPCYAYLKIEKKKQWK